MKPTAPDFTITRVFDAPRDLVWSAFTDPDKLTAWWGPPGSTLRVSKMDFRPGGTYHFRSEMPDGGSVWGFFAYREITPMDRITYIHSFSDEDGKVAPSPFGGPWPARLHTTMSFADAGGATAFTLRQYPVDASGEEEAAFMGIFEDMKQGWGGTLDRLADHLAKAKS
jgi:uncharacterized protein YndB with AHSA1/START domain